MFRNEDANNKIRTETSESNYTELSSQEYFIL